MSMSPRLIAAVVAVLAAGVLIGVLIAGGGDDDGGGGTAEKTVPAIGPGPFSPQLDFIEPPELAVGDGPVELEARNGRILVSDVKVSEAQSYVPVGASEVAEEPGLLGPTLTIDPGETLDITLDNQLTVPPGITGHSAETCGGADHPGGDPAGEHGDAPTTGPQFTNLHFHGLHVTPTTRREEGVRVFGDNVLLDAPKGTSRFRFKIPPDHELGTFWYHAHRHGCTDDQVFRGLAGMLIIGDSRTELPEPYREVSERVLALKDIQVEPQPEPDGSHAIPADHDWANPTHRTVNGRVNPKMSIRPGETQLWRVANVSSALWYQVALVNPAADDNPDQFTVVAQDGNTLERGRTEDGVLLAPGERVDVLVKGPESGTRVLKTLPFDQGRLVFGEDTLATLEVKDEAAPALPELGPLSPRLRPFPKPRGEDRRFVFDIKGQGPNKPPLFTINGRVFDPSPDSPPLAEPELRTTETWTLLNRSGEYHPFHIHQDDFRVVSINDKPVDEGSKMDVIPLPPLVNGKPGKVVIEMPFQDFDGKFVFHCHILDHEDGGMMGRVDLAPAAPN
ncbi:MAG TPA: multicopper oxidase family protein [Thermoleophilaceae bacterium]|jgi:FtsP/CotA-like multicopper oxidase with cupredoxin domain